MSTAVSRRHILRTYRHVYQHGLRAVQYAQPARYILRDRLRRLFRDGDPADFDQQRIDNTLEFLRGAALHKGLEHRIVKSLLFVWFHETHAKAVWSKGQREEVKIKYTAFDGFNHTLQMLDDTMGTCLR